MYDQLKKIMSTKFKVPEDEIQPSSSYEELGLDSLDMVELSLVIEQDFGIQVSDDELADAETLDRTITLLLCRNAAVL